MLVVTKIIACINLLFIISTIVDQIQIHEVRILLHKERQRRHILLHLNDLRPINFLLRSIKLLFLFRIIFIGILANRFLYQLLLLLFTFLLIIFSSITHLGLDQTFLRIDVLQTSHTHWTLRFQWTIGVFLMETRIIFNSISGWIWRNKRSHGLNIWKVLSASLSGGFDNCGIIILLDCSFGLLMLSKIKDSIL